MGYWSRVLRSTEHRPKPDGNRSPRVRIPRPRDLLRRQPEAERPRLSQFHLLLRGCRLRYRPMPYGKYAGLTMPEIVFADPDHFFYVVEKGAYPKEMEREAVEIYQKATHIRIPRVGSGGVYAEYLSDPITGKFSGLEIVSASHEPSGLRLTSINMSIPRVWRGYDKRGNRILVHAVKRILFGSASTPMGRERCEAFFADDSNFDLIEAA